MDLGGQQMVIEQLEEGMALADKAKQWVHQNRSAWADMEYQAAWYVSQGRHFSIAKLAEDARASRRLKGVDEFSLNNDLRAPMARMLIKKHPDWKQFIEMRESKVDGLV